MSWLFSLYKTEGAQPFINLDAAYQKTVLRSQIVAIMIVTAAIGIGASIWYLRFSEVKNPTSASQQVQTLVEPVVQSDFSSQQAELPAPTHP